MIRRLLPAALLVALAAAGCGAADKPLSAPSPSATTSAAPKNEVECVNINRAYNAWDSAYRPKTADDFANANLGTIKSAMEAGDDFRKAVTGYDDQASKNLAVAVAEYNLELAFANAEMAISGKVKAEQAQKLETAATKIESDYRSWKTATCS